MGNSSVHPQIFSPSDCIHKDIPELLYLQPLGKGWLLKTAKCSGPENFPLVVKILPREHLGNNQSRDKVIQHHIEKLYVLKEQAFSFNNVCPYQKFIDTRSRLYIIRQYFYNNLLERVQTRPSLTQTEKIWFTFLLLKALAESHRKNIYHGDIKLENVMLTSWNWLYLTDFASYKPTFISAQDPHVFSCFFDNQQTRCCYLAPERFDEDKKGGQGELTQEMDIFSLGCLIADLFLDNVTFMSLSELLRYKKGKSDEDQYNPLEKLARIKQKSIRRLVESMISLNPSDRKNAMYYLENWTSLGFPAYFEELFQHSKSLMTQNADEKIRYMSKQFEQLKEKLKLKTNKQSSFDKNQTISDPMNALDASFIDTENFVNRIIDPEPGVFEGNGDVDLSSSFLGHSTFFDENDTSRESQVQLDPSASICPGMNIFLSFICACIHEIESEPIKLEAILLLDKLGEVLDDKCRLQRIIPYLISTLKDPKTSLCVKEVCMKSLLSVLGRVHTFPPSDIKIFPEYILPSLKQIVEKAACSEGMLLYSIANNIGPLARISLRFLTASEDLTQSILITKKRNSQSEVGAAVAKTEEAALRDIFVAIFQTISAKLSAFPSSHERMIRCALLQNSLLLQESFGMSSTFELLFPMMKAFFRDGPTWDVRCSIFFTLTLMCRYHMLPSSTVQRRILPFLLQSIYIPEDLVINSILSCLLSTLDYLQGTSLFAIIDAILPLVLHPARYIRKNAIFLIHNISKESGKLSKADMWSYVMPILSSFVRGKTIEFYDCLEEFVEPVSASAFYNVTRYCRSLCSFSNQNIYTMIDEQSEVWKKRKTEVEQLFDDFLGNDSKHFSRTDKSGLEAMKPFIVSSVLYYPRASLESESESACEAFSDEKLVESSSQLLSTIRFFVEPKKRRSKVNTNVYLGRCLTKEKQVASWRPTGKLLVSLEGEHTNSVNSLCSSPDHCYFFSGSTDKTVRVWDVETVKYGTKSMLTIPFASSVTKVSSIHQSESIAVGEENGTFSGVLVEVEASKAFAVSLPDAVIDFGQISDHSFLVASTGHISVVDMREKEAVFSHCSAPRLGFLQSFLLHSSGDWAVTATSRGIYSIWDVRMLSKANEWRQPQTKRSLSNGSGIARLALANDETSFFASTMHSEIYQWDAGSSVYSRVFHTLQEKWKLPVSSPLPSPWEYATCGAMKWKRKVNEMPQKALYSLGDVLFSGGEDGSLRSWHLSDPKRSCILSSAKSRSISYSYDMTSFQPEKRKVTLVQETQKMKKAKHSFSGATTNHKDCINDICILRNSNNPTLISCSRDGVIKVWK